MRSSLRSGLDQSALKLLLLEEKRLRAMFEFQQDMGAKRMCVRLGHGGGVVFVSKHVCLLRDVQFGLEGGELVIDFNGSAAASSEPLEFFFKPISATGGDVGDFFGRIGFEALAFRLGFHASH